MRTASKFVMTTLASLMLLAPLASSANAESRNGRTLPSRQMMRGHHMMHRPMMHRHSMRHRHMMRHHAMRRHSM